MHTMSGSGGGDQGWLGIHVYVGDLPLVAAHNPHIAAVNTRQPGTSVKEGGTTQPDIARQEPWSPRRTT